MNSTERVRNTILGKETDRQPVYGWVAANLSAEITQEFGSVAAFEDYYTFDAAHLFAGPGAFRRDVIEKIRTEEEELTPDLLADADIFTDPDEEGVYQSVLDALAFYKQRGRFCYIQTPGFFEQFNDVFGIENHLMYVLLYPEALAELYRRQAEWTVRFADHCIRCGVDMIHLSDDWGSQKDLLFSPSFWRSHIFPNMKYVVDEVHSRGCFASLHSDGCIRKVTDGIAELGIDLVHPWQETAGMSYEDYLAEYQNQFAIMGGICVQSALGLLPQVQLEAEIRRVFSLLRGKRWVCCTTHFVQNHCSIEDLRFAFDLIRRLAAE